MKEKQARLATDGGPPFPETNIDPDIYSGNSTAYYGNSSYSFYIKYVRR